jgi:hypothetical protein
MQGCFRGPHEGNQRMMPAMDRLPARIAIPIIVGVSLSGWALFAAFLWLAL